MRILKAVIKKAAFFYKNKQIIMAKLKGKNINSSEKLLTITSPNIDILEEKIKYCSITALFLTKSF